jgi:RimK family alpha-L-glutamate ligase
MHTVGILYNPYATNVPNSLIAAAGDLAVAPRVIDAGTIKLVTNGDNSPAYVMDRRGVVEVDSLAPYLLYGFPAAIHALRLIGRSAYTQNPIDGVMIADDKASTAEALAHAGVAQVRSFVCALDLELALGVAAEIGYPVVLKRALGAQGRWVRRAADSSAFEVAFRELEREGPGTLILQPEVVECSGQSLRVVITGSNVLASAERSATSGEWRSNIAGGATQVPVNLTDTELELAYSAASTLGLRHAGIDILRTANGPRVLEVNSCPDFTSMEPYYPYSLAHAVLSASRQ